jgi:hypothetical protein
MFPPSHTPSEDDKFKLSHVPGASGYDVLIEPRDIRSVRASEVELARFVHFRQQHNRGILILEEPRVTRDRLLREWRNLKAMLQGEIASNLSLVILDQGKPEWIDGEPRGDDEAQIVIALESERRRNRRPTDVFYDILRILINQWIKHEGPVTSGWLCDTAGCTYPTVALALRQLQPYLKRHSDRRVELKGFPREEWTRLVVNADKVRDTRRFADRSGQPRSVEHLITRVQKLPQPVATDDVLPMLNTPPAIAIGGVPGTKRFFPTLDVIGIPRLDLTIHCRSRALDLDFVRRLDPGLQPADVGEPARVAVHVLRQPHVFFERDDTGILWADPVECLLDLHEMRLEPQALEVIRSLPFKPGVAHA